MGHVLDSTYKPVENWYDIPEKVIDHTYGNDLLWNFLPASIIGGIVFVALLLLILYLVYSAREKFNRITVGKAQAV